MSWCKWPQFHKFHIFLKSTKFVANLICAMDFASVKLFSVTYVGLCLAKKCKTQQTCKQSVKQLSWWQRLALHMTMKYLFTWSWNLSSRVNFFKSWSMLKRTLWSNKQIANTYNSPNKLLKFSCIIAGFRKARITSNQSLCCCCYCIGREISHLFHKFVSEKPANLRLLLTFRGVFQRIIHVHATYIITIVYIIVNDM